MEAEDCRCQESGSFCEQEVTATESLEKAQQVFGKGGHVVDHWGHMKIGFHASDGSWIVMGRGKTWGEAYQNAFGEMAFADLLKKKKLVAV